MSRIIDVICHNNNADDVVQSAKTLVEEHLVVVSYVIPVKLITNDGAQVYEGNTTMLILKSKDVVFKEKLLPRLRSLNCQSSLVLPIVDVVPDYRGWVEKEVIE